MKVLFMLLKGLDIGFKDVDTKQGVVSGYFAVFGNKDLDGELSIRDRFLKLFKKEGHKVKN